MSGNLPSRWIPKMGTISSLFHESSRTKIIKPNKDKHPLTTTCKKNLPPPLTTQCPHWNICHRPASKHNEDWGSLRALRYHTILAYRIYNLTRVTSPSNSNIGGFCLIFSVLFPYFLFIFYLPRCTLPNFPPISSLASLEQHEGTCYSWTIIINEMQ